MSSILKIQVRRAEESEKSVWYWRVALPFIGHEFSSGGPFATRDEAIEAARQHQLKVKKDSVDADRLAALEAEKQWTDVEDV